MSERERERERGKESVCVCVSTRVCACACFCAFAYVARATVVPVLYKHEKCTIVSHKLQFCGVMIFHRDSDLW